jgi:hypothetical protein
MTRRRKQTLPRLRCLWPLPARPQLNSEILAAVRALAQGEGRPLQALIIAQMAW